VRKSHTNGSRIRLPVLRPPTNQADGPLVPRPRHSLRPADAGTWSRQHRSTLARDWRILESRSAKIELCLSCRTQMVPHQRCVQDSHCRGTPRMAVNGLLFWDRNDPRFYSWHLEQRRFGLPGVPPPAAAYGKNHGPRSCVSADMAIIQPPEPKIRELRRNRLPAFRRVIRSAFFRTRCGCRIAYENSSRATAFGSTSEREL